HYGAVRQPGASQSIDLVHNTPGHWCSKDFCKAARGLFTAIPLLTVFEAKYARPNTGLSEQCSQDCGLPRRQARIRVKVADTATYHQPSGSNWKSRFPRPCCGTHLAAVRLYTEATLGRRPPIQLTLRTRLQPGLRPRHSWDTSPTPVLTPMTPTTADCGWGMVTDTDRRPLPSRTCIEGRAPFARLHRKLAYEKLGLRRTTKGSG
ncbi:hypothetical protein MTO96_044268, partial [Rhipicephalus appendiculatus]